MRGELNSPRVAPEVHRIFSLFPILYSLFPILNGSMTQSQTSNQHP
ncbi:MAG: hypothetical protein F6K50_28310 [Moorea sp. SIO3I7]|nr:hypothetical protein [Moorena sp. SIO3I7]